MQQILVGASGQLLSSPYGPAPQNLESNNAQDPQDRVTGNQIANSENFYANFAQQYSNTAMR